MSVTVWKSSRLRIGRTLKKSKKRELVNVLVCDAVPGLAVRVGEYFDSKYEGRSFPLWYGGQVVSANTGHTLGPCFYGDEEACEFAASIADVFDWARYDGSQKLTEDHVKQINAALFPIAERNGVKYQAFLAEHRRKEEAA